jgi:hypothetical protein
MMNFFLLSVAGIFGQRVVPELYGVSTIKIEGTMDFENSNEGFDALVIALDSGELTNYTIYFSRKDTSRLC